jgi:C4-type Zn-finger protein
VLFRSGEEDLRKVLEILRIVSTTNQQERNLKVNITDREGGSIVSLLSQ